MIKFRMYSKIYDKAKAEHDLKEDYEIAEIAKNNSKLKGRVLGAGAGIALSALSRNKLKGLSKSNNKVIKAIRKVDPEIFESATSSLAPIATTLAGAHYGGEITGNAAKKLVLKELDDKRNNKSSKMKAIYNKL